MLQLLSPWRSSTGRRGAGYAFLYEPDTSDEQICLDCAATSLDLRTAQLLGLAAVRLRDNCLLTSEALVLDLRAPGANLSPLAAVERLLRFIGARPLVGYYLDFDFSLLAPWLEPLIGGPLPNRSIEVSALYHERKARLLPADRVDLRFESLRRDLELPALDAASPLSHAVLAGLMYLKLRKPA